MILNFWNVSRAPTPPLPDEVLPIDIIDMLELMFSSGG
jgi:hypothetical protein